MSTPLHALPDEPPFTTVEAAVLVLDQILRRARLDDAFSSAEKKERLMKALVHPRISCSRVV